VSHARSSGRNPEFFWLLRQFLRSIGYIVNAIAAHYLFGEAVTTTRWLGIGFIVLGVWLVAKS
jgi:drug/metabolite transporter (DMT)-like permease